MKVNNKKECKECKKTKALTLFLKGKNKCRECINKRKKETYKPEQVKQQRLRSKSKNVIRFRCNAARHNWKKRSDHALPDLDILETHIRSLLEKGCFYSKKELTELTFGVDHKIPLKRGGTNDLSNLVVVDQKINKAKGDMTDLEFKALLKLINKWEDQGSSLLARLRAANTVFVRK